MNSRYLPVEALVAVVPLINRRSPCGGAVMSGSPTVYPKSVLLDVAVPVGDVPIVELVRTRRNVLDVQRARNGYLGSDPDQRKHRGIVEQDVVHANEQLILGIRVAFGLR